MHVLRRNRGCKRSERKHRIGKGKQRTRNGMDSVLALDVNLVEFSMCHFRLSSREKSIVRKHLRTLHHGLRPGGVISGAIPLYLLPKKEA